MRPSALRATKRMNVDRYFVDSNVLLYAYDKSDPVKRAQAKAWLAWLWENACGALSWQVLQEFYFNAIRKFGVPVEEARRYLKVMSEWSPPEVTIGMIERAWHWNDQAQASFWDGLIVAAAERTRCTFLLSEDLQAGRKFDSITVLNPFKTPPPHVGNERSAAQ
jgi:predicted nucleic acid-binding protein